MIPAFDIHHKEFETRIGNERITSNVYKLRTSSDNAEILKSILCKTSHPDNHPTIQCIPYGIQSITNKNIYKTIIKKQNAFISGSSTIPLYNGEERNINKFKQLIEIWMYVQDWTNSWIYNKGRVFPNYYKDWLQKSNDWSKIHVTYIYLNRKITDIN